MTKCYDIEMTVDVEALLAEIDRYLSKFNNQELIDGNAVRDALLDFRGIVSAPERTDDG